jgi:HD-like signal output (HDOD) protein/CheY-like chemotaxis protein
MPASIMLLEPRQIYRDLFAMLLAKSGYETTEATNGVEALAILRQQKTAMIVMDVELNGLNGLNFLERVRKDFGDIPVVILTDRRDKETVIQAARLGVRDYIFKSTLSAQRLVERIGQLITGVPNLPIGKPGSAPTIPSAAALSAPAARARTDAPPPKAQPAKAPAAAPRKKETAGGGQPDPNQWPRLLTREKTLSRLDTVAGGKTIAGVVAQVVAEASSPNADLSDIVKIIQGDPVLASRVLHLANSAATGARSRVHNIEEAARTIGIRGIQNMAISVGIFGAFPPDEQDGFSTMRCWQHSFAVAELMGRIVRQRNPELESLNHLVGLCHDLGEILLRQHFAAEHQEILRYAAEHQLAIHQVESTGLGIRRPELISRLLTKVGLPPNVCDAIREFHERQIKDQSGGMSAGTQLLQMANQVAHGLLLTPTIHEEIKPISRSEWRVLGTDKTPPQIDPATMRSEIILATNVLARLPSQEEKQLIEPMLPHARLKIGYLRPDTFIAMDPLAYALQLLADTTLVNEMPTMNQMQEFDALVVTGIRPGVPPVALEELRALSTAAGMPEMPILALVGQMSPVPEGPGTVLRSYPIRLEDLSQWIMCAEQSMTHKQPASI